MKITILIMTIACVNVSAKVYSQINLSARNIPLATAISSIENQSGFPFFYKELLVRGISVNPNLHNATLKQALDQLLYDQQLEYTIVNNTVIIKKRETGVTSEKAADTVKNITVTGKVTDSSGKPLAGATISHTVESIIITPTSINPSGQPLVPVRTATPHAVNQTTYSRFTDDNGEFTISDIKKGTILTVTYVGYTPVKIKATSKSKLTISLQSSTSELDETRVIGYGTDSRRFSVGSVSTITAADIEKQPVSNVLLALEGRIPGLNVTTTSGVPGSLVTLQVRGQNTLSNSSFGQYDQPLIIIDGVPFAAQNMPIDGSGGLSNDLGNDVTGLGAINSINPADIESISVLRDADATSIYGTQGSNGVIIITTKKGKPGKTTVAASFYSGYNSNARPVTLLNTQQYLQIRKEALMNDGETPSPSNQPDLTVFDQNKYTNFYNLLYGKTSNSTQTHVSVSGGSQNTTALVSAGYGKSDFDFPGNFTDERFTLHSALHHSSQDNRFTIDYVMDNGYSRNNSSSPQTFIGPVLPPNTPNLIDPQGNLVWNYNGADLSGYNFYGYLRQPFLLQDYNLNNSLQLAYKLTKDLKFSANLGYNRNNTNEYFEQPILSQAPVNDPQAFANYTTNTLQTINIEPQLNYNHNFGKSSFSALIGATYKKDIGNSVSATGIGYPSDILLGSIDGAKTKYIQETYNLYKYSAIFGRINYIYDQKYIINVTGRRDASSNFGPGRQIGNFGSAGLGWIFSEEPVIKTALPFMSYGKLSVNYGTSGSDGVRPYNYQPFWQINNNAFYPTNLYNPDYSWAVKKTLNLAVDLGFFHDKLLFNATYYQSREGNQLVDYPLPTITGFSSVIQNFGADVQNTGLEFSITSKNINTSKFSWSSHFNISFNSNKLLSFPGIENSSYASIYMVGRPVTEVYGLKYKDVNPTTGLFEFYKADGTLTYNPNFDMAAQGGDKVPIANSAPKFFGGIGNEFSYKNLSLSVFFQFSKSVAPNYLFQLYNQNAGPGGPLNLPTQVLGQYWQKPGDHAYLEKLSSDGTANNLNGSTFENSSGVFSDDTYLRLKNFSLSYTLPDAYLKKLNVKNFRISIRGENLLTFTNYKAGDPETPGTITGGLPIQRTLVLDLSFNL